MVILDYILLFLREIVSLFIEMAPYITLGVLIAGVLHVFLSKDFVARHIGGNNISSVFKSALFGVPLPLCSCGVVPTAVYLKNTGASKSSVLSFLISTPQTGVDSIAATWGMLGPIFAFFRAITALITGALGGIANFMLDRFTGKTEKTGKTGKIENLKESRAGTFKSMDTGRVKKVKSSGLFRNFSGKLKEIFNYAFFEILDDIAVNFVIGLAVAAVISVAIPDNFFAGSFLSHPLVSMLFMIIIGIPMYICSTSSIPIALAMIAKGFSPGAAYVFLVAGPATNAASLAIITKALGKKTTLRYLATIITGSLVFGFVMDFIYSNLGSTPFDGAGGVMQDEHSKGIFSVVVSVFFLFMLLMVLFKQIKGKITSRRDSSTLAARTGEEAGTKMNIEGMTCGHCKMTVENALSKVEGIQSIHVSLKGNSATLEGDFSLEEAEKAVKDAGYAVTGSIEK